MSHVVRAVAAPALAAGFRLAGLAVDEAVSPRDAAGALERLAADDSVGIVLVQQDLYEGVGAALRHDLERRAVPIIVPVPPAAWTAGQRHAEDYILEMLRLAIGYRVRLQ